MNRRKQPTAPGPEGFSWRGIRFEPPSDPGGLYSSTPIELDHRTGDWKCQAVRREVRLDSPPVHWHARLRIGSDRFPGVGATREAALDAATAEAQSVAAFIVAMLPPASAPQPIRERSRIRRAIKVRRAGGK